jgi:hypothetical protein
MTLPSVENNSSKCHGETMKPVSRRKFLRFLKERGWVLDRTDGDHDIYCQGP